MADPFTTVEEPIKRDRWGRPMVIPPDGGEAVPYTRCTTVAGSLDNLYGLMAWKQRQTALGLADRPDLQLAVTAHRNDKNRLDDICEQALEASRSSAAATTGIALHKLTDKIDAGQDLPEIPSDAAADLDAYRQVTAPLEPVAIEPFTVHDGLKIGGTPDRIVNWRGTNYIADLKTGKIKYSAGKIAMQLAIYSRSKFYNHTTGRRRDLPPVDQDRGIVVHLPSGQGECTLHWVDIAFGWESVDLAVKVRKWRKRRGWLTEIGDTDPLTEKIRGVDDVDDLERLYFAHEDDWTDRHTELAKARRKELTDAA